MKSMKLFALALTLSALTATAYAQDVAPQTDVRKLGGGFARTQALGGSQAATSLTPGSYDQNLFVQDVTYMLTNPAYINVYNNYVWGGYDGGASLSSRTFAGANFKVTDQVTLGILFGIRDAQVLTGATSVGTNTRGIFDVAQFPAGTAINNTMSIVFGYQASPDLSLGLQLYGAGINSQDKTETSQANANSTTDRSATSLGADLGLVYVNPQVTGELAVKFRTNSASRKTVTNAANNSTPLDRSSEGGIELAVNARAFVAAAPNLKVVPVVGFTTFSWNEKNADQPAPTGTVEKITYSLRAIEAGVGINYTTKNALLAGGVSFISAGEERKDENDNGVSGNTTTTTFNNTTLPKVNLGAEYYALDWLTLRLGYVKTIQSGSLKTEATFSGGNSTNTNTGANTANPNTLGEYATFGVGFKFGDFNLDGALSNNFLVNGPNVISGQSTKLFGQISAHYSF